MQGCVKSISYLKSWLIDSPASSFWKPIICKKRLFYIFFFFFDNCQFVYSNVNWSIRDVVYAIVFA